MAQMQLCGATKEFGAARVIDKLDMTVEDGSLTVFVGPSGCGKSTLLRMIAGIEEISGGDLLINGERMNGSTPVERGVAMVFQNYALYPHLSVEKNVGFGLKMADMPRGEIRERVQDAARILKIENLLKRKPSQLSGGQRQRVAIGRAIVRQPKLFLFDEPLSNLDAELRVAMRIEIAKLHRTLGTTMIYVTHDQTEAMTLASKIVVLRDGKVEQQGTPVDLFEDPDNMFVAGFIGSPQMNFLQARLSGDGGAPVVSLKAGPELSPGHLERMPAQDEVMLGIRPEHLSIDGRADVQIQVVVDVVENLGGRYFVYAMTESGEAVNFELRDHRPPDPEDRLTLGFAIRDMRLFEPSGPRLRTRPVN